MTTGTTENMTTTQQTSHGISHEIRIGVKRLDMVLTGMVGSPLVIHNFSEKAKQQIRDKHAQAAKQKKGKRDIDEEFLLNRYVDSKGRECVPMTAVKKALVSAGTAMDNLTKVALRQALFVYSPDDESAVHFPIETLDGKPAVGVMREDAVTISVSTRGLVYRPDYPTWQIRVRIEYNPRLISQEQVLELTACAGWGVGICEGRPEKTSALGWGRFRIASYAAV